MMIVFLSVMCAILLASTVLMFFYIRNYLNRLYSNGLDLRRLDRVMEEYHDNLEGVFQLDSLYGDPVLAQLLQKTLAVRSEIEVFRELIELVGEDAARIEVMERHLTEEEEEMRRADLWSDYIQGEPMNPFAKQPHNMNGKKE